MRGCNKASDRDREVKAFFAGFAVAAHVLDVEPHVFEHAVADATEQAGGPAATRRWYQAWTDDVDEREDERLYRTGQKLDLPDRLTRTAWTRKRPLPSPTGNV